ncbi:hypothetical protein MTO96_024438 [Rhipicephalus appendiculatus]
MAQQPASRFWIVAKIGSAAPSYFLQEEGSEAREGLWAACLVPPLQRSLPRGPLRSSARRCVFAVASRQQILTADASFLLTAAVLMKNGWIRERRRRSSWDSAFARP